MRPGNLVAAIEVIQLHHFKLVTVTRHHVFKQKSMELWIIRVHKKNGKCNNVLSLNTKGDTARWWGKKL